MKSPITGKEMILSRERRLMDFRKQTFEIVFHYYKCKDSGEQFTTTQLDELNINQLYNQYRDKFNIPFPEEIKKTRNKYGLSATRMSEILGFGVNSYGRYEAGDVPSVSNARLIQMIDDPKKFIDMVELCDLLDEKTKAKLFHKGKLLIKERKQNIFNSNLKDYLLGNHLANIYSGYRSPSFEKLTEMVVYFAEKTQPFKTKMNKLLFYADFLMFKQSCYSISGVKYKAIDMGPIPYNFQSVFEFLANSNQIEIVEKLFSQAYYGYQFKAKEGRHFNPNLFSNAELDVLEKVSTAFKTTCTKDIIELSHLEDAWKKNEKNRSFISYEYAFELNQI